MGVEKLERIMWRLRSKHGKCIIIPNRELRRAIMYECGVHPDTIKRNRRALIDLGWIRHKSTQAIRLTGTDLTGD